LDLRRITHPYYCNRTKIIRRTLIDARGLVLDIGCADGHFTKLASEHATFVIGMDTNATALKRAEPSSKIGFIMADAQWLPYHNAVFDNAICFDVIEHMQNDKQFLQEVKRVLKEGGALHLTTLNRNRLTTIIRKIIGKPRHYPHRIGGGYHIREYTKDEFGNLLTSQGFKVEGLKSFFLGITLRHGYQSVGFIHFPKFLEKYCFGLFAKARKKEAL